MYFIILCCKCKGLLTHLCHLADHVGFLCQYHVKQVELRLRQLSFLIVNFECLHHVCHLVNVYFSLHVPSVNQNFVRYNLKFD